ncbi:hypothetical protein HYU23_02870 [Candidatus Woesearchaeota archaeon]|nr:hypothetical protein [Candidatus Woesearchaeota archaeon]
MKVEVNNIGKYKFLFVNNKLWMSNDENEQLYTNEAISKCKGNVLIVGYGIGLIYNKLKEINYLKKITIVEISKDVIKKVGVKIRENDELIINDFLKNKFEEKYETILLDIWLDWSEKSYKEIFLPSYKKEEKILEKNGIIWAWGEHEMRRFHENK